VQLLGRSAAQLIKSDLDVMRYLEQRLLFLRLTMGFAFALGGDEVARLCVWGVRM